MKKLKIDEFIEKANLIHLNKYDYLDSIYENSKKKLEIKCHEHGIFKQSPNDHLMGRGCPECGGKRKLTKVEFIKRANLIHLSKYSYEKVNYINIKTKVTICCKIHGDFSQTPDNHLYGDNRISSGNGCPKCKKKFKLENSEFIERAILVHGTKYNYEKVNYISNKKLVKIICKDHGCFLQNPNNHLSGCGCPKCNESKGEREISKILDDLKIIYTREFTFSDLKSKSKLRFDFALFENDIIKCLIELNPVNVCSTSVD